MKYVIVGGVAGGATAAARIRRNTEKAEIILFERGEYISYANCGLPYYIGGVIQERDRLFVQTPEAFSTRFRIDVRVRSEVMAIDTARKEVKVRTSDGKEYTETYDKLLLSPGASPVRPPLPGINNEGIFTLRNVADTDRIKAYMQSHEIKKAVIVGGGFIGLEMAENLHHAGIEVAVVEMADQVMGPIDFSMAALALGLIDGIYDADPVPEDSTPEQVFQIFNNRLHKPQNENSMNLDELKRRPRFKNCATDDDFLREIGLLETEAGKVPALDAEVTRLKGELKVFQDKARATSPFIFPHSTNKR